MYEVLSSEFVNIVTTEKESMTLSRVIIQVDTTDDVPTALDSWAVGSACIIANEHKMLRLNSRKEWV